MFTFYRASPPSKAYDLNLKKITLCFQKLTIRALVIWQEFVRLALLWQAQPVQVWCQV
jgi:hypothetical protein